MKIVVKEKIKDYLNNIYNSLCSRGKFFSKNKMAHSEFFTFIFLIINFICGIFWFDIVNSYIVSLIITIFLASMKQIILDKFVFDLKPEPIEFIMSVKFPLLITLTSYYL